MAAKLPPALRNIKILMTWAFAPVNMEGVHCAPAGVVTAQLGAPPMLGDPESVMRMAEVPADDVMAVAGVNVTVAVVAVALAWEPRVMAGAAVIKLDDMARNVPVVDASSKVVPSLVVAALTASMAFCGKTGVVNWAKFKLI